MAKHTSSAEPGTPSTSPCEKHGAPMGKFGKTEYRTLAFIEVRTRVPLGSERVGPFPWQYAQNDTIKEGFFPPRPKLNFLGIPSPLVPAIERGAPPPGGRADLAMVSKGYPDSGIPFLVKSEPPQYSRARTGRLVPHTASTAGAICTAHG